MNAERIAFFLEQAAKHLTAAADAKRGARPEAARADLLQAAEAILNAARLSTGALKALRTRKAEQILALAKAMPASAANRTAQAAVEAAGTSPWLVRERPQVRFRDVAGLDEVKREIHVRLIYPLLHPDKARHYGVKTGGGLLLWGPPGTGKTLVARAVAGEVQAAFFTVKPSEIMSKWVGESEQNVARLFDEARAAAPAVIFIDEVEALAPHRRTSGSTVMQRVVPQILAELEGFEGRRGTLLFIGATNEPWSIDPAMMRPGRFDVHIYVGLPDRAARRQMLDLHLKDKPLGRDVDLDRLAQALEGYSGADIAYLCAQATTLPFIESIREGTDRPISRADFETVLGRLRPSVSREELRRYEQFQTR